MESLGSRLVMLPSGFLMMLLNYQEKNYDDLFNLNQTPVVRKFSFVRKFFPPLERGGNYFNHQFWGLGCERNYP